MSALPSILALDIGSSSARARLYDASLNEIPVGEAATWRYEWELAGGAMEIDAERLLEGVTAVVDAAVSDAASSGIAIEAVAVTTFWHSLLALGPGRRPVTPVYGWGDSRAAAVLPMLEGRLEPAAYHRRTGCFLSAEYPAARIAWLLDRGLPGAAVHAWASFGDYLEARLFGTLRTSRSIASGTGLLDRSTLRWDEETLSAVGVAGGAEQLPAIARYEPVRGLGAPWARRWPALASIPWFPAVGDGGCANLGSGAVGSRIPGLTVGTSAAVRVVRPIDGSPPPDALWDYRLGDDHAVTGRALSNGGNGLAFLRRLFPTLDLAALNEALRAGAPPGAETEPTTVPRLLAERGADPGAAEGGALIGLTPTTTPLDIARTWMESLARAVAAPYRELERAFGTADEVRATGGAFRALPGWIQTFADVLGRPVLLSGEPEATSRGAAILAARTLGWIASLDAVDSAIEARAEPDPERHRAHTRVAEREHELSRTLRDLTL